MNFTLDDIDYLTLTGRKRLDETGKYDISYYENYIKEDSQLIKGLMDYVKDRTNQVQDEKMKSFVERNLKMCIEKTYDTMCEKKPREESEKIGDSGAVGYYKSHPHAHYIEHDFPKYINNNYTRIVGFMNELYQRFKYTEKKGMPDQDILYDIFKETKNTCKKLGIHCINGQQLCDIIAENDIDTMSMLDMDMEINDDYNEEPMNNDIEITSLPYSVTLPTFSYAGVGETYQFPVSKSVVWYNKSYIDKLDKKSNELNSMVDESTISSSPRTRNPQESDEDYMNYLKEFYGESPQHK